MVTHIDKNHIHNHFVINSVNWMLCLIAFVASAIPLIIPKCSQKKVQASTKYYADQSTEYLDFVKDKLNGRLELRKYNSLNSILFNHNNINDSVEKSRYKMRALTYGVSLFTEFIGGVSFVIVFLVGGILAIKNYVTIGGVIGVIQLMNYMVNPIVRIANSKTQINTTKDLIDRFPANTESNNYNTELFDRTTNLNNQSNKSELLLKSKITISQLQFNYLNEDVHIIDNLNITFEKGKKYLINGESGNGKSTLAKILARELFPNNGKIYFDNTNIYDINDQLWNSSVRYVDQDSYMFNDTIYENINMYRSLSHEDIQSTLTNLGLQSIELNKLVNDSIGLSGGQKDRVCLARSLCELPEILIVDEPTAALDFNNSIKVFKYLTKLPLTLIVISHESNQEILDLFDQQITLPAIGGEEDA